jgi:hypothetical protein
VAAAGAESFIPTYVGGGSLISGTANCAIDLDVQAGDLIIAYAVSNSIPATLSVSDEDTNSYSNAFSQYAPASGTVIEQAFYAFASQTNSAMTVTLHTTNSGNYIACSAANFRSATGATIDKTAEASYTSTAATTGTTDTTSVANELLIGVFGHTGSTGSEFTATAPFTLSSQVGSAVSPSLSYQIVSSTGTYTAYGTISSGSPLGGGVIFTFKGP